MAEVRVQLPLGAFRFGAWGSLETRVLREHEIGGSNPPAPTLTSRDKNQRDRLGD
jgi:hypothetical protein